MEKSYKPYEIQSTESPYKMSADSLTLNKMMVPFSTKTQTIDVSIDPVGGNGTYTETINTVRFDLLPYGNIINTSDIYFEADLAVLATASKILSFDGSTQSIVKEYRLIINGETYKFENIALINEIISDYKIDYGYKNMLSQEHEKFSTILTVQTDGSGTYPHGEQTYTMAASPVKVTSHISFNPLLPFLTNGRFSIPLYGLKKFQLEIVLNPAKNFFVEVKDVTTALTATYELTNAKLNVSYIKLMEGEEEYISGIPGNIMMTPYVQWLTRDTLLKDATAKQVVLPNSISSCRFIVASIRVNEYLSSTLGRHYTRRMLNGVTEMYITNNGLEYPTNHLRLDNSNGGKINKLLMNNIKSFSKLNLYSSEKQPRLNTILCPATNSDDVDGTTDGWMEMHVDFLIDTEMINENGNRLTGSDFSTGNAILFVKGTFLCNSIIDVYAISDAMVSFEQDGNGIDIKINNSWNRKLLLNE